jgi:transketolase
MPTRTIQPNGFADLYRLMSLQSGDEKHDTAATSTMAVLWVLYDRVLRVSPKAVRDADRDRFLLSKGHGPQALYAVLAAKGFVTEEDLVSFARFDSILGHHPDRNLVPGVEISSGSLGHGLPIAVGMALGLRARDVRNVRVVCLVGDGELDEGSNHEAIALAGRFALSSLTAVVVDNGSARHGWPGGIAQRFTGEGWCGATVDGSRQDDILAALHVPTDDRPRAVVCLIGAKE